MLDQSFSAENFRKILDYENRKGVYLEGEFFSDLEPLTKEIKDVSQEIRAGRGVLSEVDLQKLVDKKAFLKAKKENELDEKLQLISSKVTVEHLEFLLREIDIPGFKRMYNVIKTPESYFAIKQVQHNISRLYKVKQSNRFEIVSQIKHILSDNFPKVVIRTDIKNFYESIPHETLLKKINEENLLGFLSKKIIRQIIRSYELKSGSSLGVPRGVGISAYLSELYMKDLDRELRAIPCVTYFARYVDDIIIVFTPQARNDKTDYLESVRNIIESDTHRLQLNLAKTRVLNLKKVASDSIQFLGYQIHLKVSGGKPQPLELSLSKKKIIKYKERIKATLMAYNIESSFDKRRSRKMLINRINFLTGNTRLHNNKNKILVGIFYSNSLLSQTSDLEHLDNSLRFHVDRIIADPKLKRRIKMFSFLDGFVKRRFTTFTPNELIDVLRIWKNL